MGILSVPGFLNPLIPQLISNSLAGSSLLLVYLKLPSTLLSFSQPVTSLFLKAPNSIFMAVNALSVIPALVQPLAQPSIVVLASSLPFPCCHFPPNKLKIASHTFPEVLCDLIVWSHTFF